MSSAQGSESARAKVRTLQISGFQRGGGGVEFVLREHLTMPGDIARYINVVNLGVLCLDRDTS
jgi:hypothetical protein